MQNFIIMLLACSVTMSILALLYMLITPILSKRYSASGRYYAWLVIVVGLIIPFRPQFSNAIIQLKIPQQLGIQFESKEFTRELEEAIALENFLIELEEAIAQENVSGKLEEAINLEAVLEELQSSTYQTNLPFNNTISDNILITAASQGTSWWHITIIVWLVGIVFCIIYHSVKHFYFMRMCKRWNEKVTDEYTINLFDDIKAKMQVSKNIGLYICPFVNSPVLIGLTSPKIILPKINFASEELTFILKHELVHYKRKDLWYKFLVILATTIHWFNPVVYIIAKVIDIQCELSCDSEVVHSENIDVRLQYSETIIGAIKNQSKLKTALSTNFYGGKNGMKKRIFSIMDMSKKKAGIAVLISVFIATSLTGMMSIAYASVDTYQNDTKITTTNKTTVTQSVNWGTIIDDYGKKDLENSSDNFISNDEKPRFYSTAALYKEPYIVEVAWNLTENEYNSYPTKAQLTLNDNTIIPVSFDEEYKQYATIKDVLSTVTELIEGRREALNPNYLNKFERPLVISVEKAPANDIPTFVEKYYKNNDYLKFSTMFSFLDNNLKTEYWEIAFKEENISPFATTVKDMDKATTQSYAERAFTEDKIEFFSVLVNNINKEAIQSYVERAYSEDKIDFFSVLVNNINKEAIQSYAERAFTEDKIEFFSVLVNNINKEAIQSYVERAYSEDKIDFFSVLVNNINKEAIQSYAERAYSEDKIDFFSVLVNNINKEAIQSYVERAYSEDKIDFFSVLVNNINKEAIQSYAERAFTEDKIDFFSVLIKDINKEALQSYKKRAYSDKKIEFFAILSY